MQNRDIAISGSFNTRDLGGYRTRDGRYVAWRKTFRSGNLASVDQTGLATLKQLSVTRVIDLRSQRERQAEPDPFGPDDSIELVGISLFDDLDPSRLPQGNVLLSLYLQALETQGKTFVEIVRQIGSSSGAALFHCTAGKDRTGLVAALVLSLAGVATEDIIADYAMTADRIRPLLDGLEKTAKTINVNEAELTPLLDCNPSTMHQTLDWLDENYRGAENYLKSHGLAEADLHQIRAHLGVA
jgi:protein-tyrosine phosphatase